MSTTDTILLFDAGRGQVSVVSLGLPLHDVFFFFFFHLKI